MNVLIFVFLQYLYLNMIEINRAEYIARINKVMDYLDNHIDQPVNLEILAKIACFSPYHFHRIFSILTEETLNSFVLRIRLEKAAQMLQYHKEMTVGEIAQNCGFTSISLFSRTFHKHAGMTANTFRKTRKSALTKDGNSYDNNGDLLSKKKKYLSESIDINKLIFPDAEIAVKRMPEMKVIYCRHKGAFYKIGHAYNTVMEWATKHHLLNFPITKLITVYHDTPGITQMKNVRQSACITIEKDIKVSGEIGKMVIPSSKYAVGRFEIGMNEFEKAWNTMSFWIVENNYSLGQGNDYEIYYDGYQSSASKFILDICIPVN